MLLPSFVQIQEASFRDSFCCSSPPPKQEVAITSAMEVCSGASAEQRSMRPVKTHAAVLPARSPIIGTLEAVLKAIHTQFKASLVRRRLVRDQSGYKAERPRAVFPPRALPLGLEVPNDVLIRARRE
jgi:hypothetical protein